MIRPLSIPENQPVLDMFEKMRISEPIRLTYENCLSRKEVNAVAGGNV